MAGLDFRDGSLLSDFPRDYRVLINQPLAPFYEYRCGVRYTTRSQRRERRSHRNMDGEDSGVYFTRVR